MTVWDIASIIFFVIVAGIFLRPLFERMRPSTGRLPKVGSPRSISESGGYRAPRPRNRREQRPQAGEMLEQDVRMRTDDVESRPARRRQAAVTAARVPVRADRIRRRMHDHTAVQEAFILKELLDPPMGLRHPRAR